MRADILLFCERALRIAVMGQETGKLDLLSFIPPEGGRILADVSEWYRSELGIDIFCLFVVPHEEDIGRPDHTTFVCRTLDDTACSLKAPFKWVPVESVEQVIDLVTALDWMHRYNAGRAPGLFTTYDWLDTFREWIGTNAGISLDRLMHHNVAPDFSLLRIQSRDKAYWFKAAGSSGDGEYGVSCLLDELFPASVPRIVARHDDWSGWLAEEVQGHDLSGEFDQEAWIATFRALALLQIRSIEHVAKFVRHGVPVRTLPHMIHEAKLFLHSMVDVMKAQPKEPPQRLSAEDLENLERHLSSLCREMVALEIPDTIVHGDINPYNVIINGETPIFLDWAEVCISSPFFCAEFLRRYFRNAFPDDTQTITKLQDAYSEPWRALLSEETIVRAWQLAPCLAPLLTALSLPSIDMRHIGSESRRGSLYRTLVRVMKREIEHLENYELLPV